MSQEGVKKDYHRTIKISLGLFQLDNRRQGDEASLVIAILWQIVHISIQQKGNQREFFLKIFWGLIAVHLTKILEREG